MITLIPNYSTRLFSTEFNEYQSIFKTEVLNVSKHTNTTHTKVEIWVWVLVHSHFSREYRNIRNTQLGIKDKILSLEIKDKILSSGIL